MDVYQFVLTEPVTSVKIKISLYIRLVFLINSFYGVNIYENNAVFGGYLYPCVVFCWCIYDLFHLIKKQNLRAPK